MYELLLLKNKIKQIDLLFIKIPLYHLRLNLL